MMRKMLKFYSIVVKMCLDAKAPELRQFHKTHTDNAKKRTKMYKSHGVTNAWFRNP